MEQTPSEKLAIAKSELIQKVADCDNMILYYIRNQASQILEELATGTEHDGIVHIDKAKFATIWKFIDQLSTRGTLDYISNEVSNQLKDKKTIKSLLTILR